MKDKILEYKENCWTKEADFAADEYEQRLLEADCPELVQMAFKRYLFDLKMLCYKMTIINSIADLVNNHPELASQMMKNIDEGWNNEIKPD